MGVYQPIGAPEQAAQQAAGHAAQSSIYSYSSEWTVLVKVEIAEATSEALLGVETADSEIGYMAKVLSASFQEAEAGDECLTVNVITHTDLLRLKDPDSAQEEMQEANLWFGTAMNSAIREIHGGRLDHQLDRLDNQAKAAGGGTMQGGTSSNSRQISMSQADLLPEEMRDYFRSVEVKHFDSKTATGSYFTDPDIHGLKDLLALAEKMPGGLNRDDRASFDKEALKDECRYLRVPCQGKNNLIDSRTLPDNERVSVVRTKPGTPCSLVVANESGQDETFATLIIGPRPSGEGECVWTAHPGAPVRPAQEDIWPEGSAITVKEVRSKLGDCWLQGRLA